ncbi:Ldh family oxidoreductase [Thermovorax subterraneus]|nr:Ldh family oxidoreductase [Thermovorax subterraneus]
MKEERLPLYTVKEFVADIFKNAGLNAAHSEIIADSLICAEARGIKSHGLVRVSTYVSRMECGATNKNANYRIEKIKGAVALLDADNGFGQVAAYYGSKLAVTLAKKYGTGVVGIKNSNHFGIASYYAMLISYNDMIGIVSTNSSPAIAPFGSYIPLLGTNPLAVSIPAKTRKPIVLDMSASVVARGKIRLAKLKNEKIPIGWALDPYGKDTDDPDLALKGSLLPIGGPKGSGLSLVIDLICGVLTGSSFTGEVKNVTDMSGPSKTGHIIMALDIGCFNDVNKFKGDIDEVIAKIKSLPSVNNSEIFMPGEIENNAEEKSKSEGIILDPKVREELNKLADKYNLNKIL